MSLDGRDLFCDARQEGKKNVMFARRVIEISAFPWISMMMVCARFASPKEVGWMFGAEESN